MDTNTNARLVYTTGATTNLVVIDYDRTMEIFFTDGERLPFTAERIVRMLNSHLRSQGQRVYQTVVGRLQIAVGGAQCELTQRAVAVIARLYSQRQDWQVEYPYLSLYTVFAMQEDGAV